MLIDLTRVLLGECVIRFGRAGGIGRAGKHHSVKAYYIAATKVFAGLKLEKAAVA